MSLNKINNLRERQSSLRVARESALRAKREAEEGLKELGWDGTQSVEKFVADLKAQSEQAKTAADAAVAEAEKLAKAFEQI